LWRGSFNLSSVVAGRGNWGGTKDKEKAGRGG